MLIKLIEHDNDPNVQKAALDALADVNPEKAERYALKTINDDDIFMVSLSLDVLRRAKSEKLNAGVKIAEEHAFRKISDPDELIRLNALVLLQQLNSDNLDAAIEKLKEDKSLLIQDELRKIRKSNS